ncbi:DNA-directed RNA polymerase subunit H [Fervidicoccus fontis]|uniref:DNA-directed RNA polymerase subunit Rpo5 n=2 Tax=Fervidicoccus fontis TaxID=683846 RepID=I0A0T6_FERFK|nr:DNA-directed RNA polymerase subunit H [Fervidicoccus fontis]AFH42593.1 DNA-directed RNA polymerase subunit H [Fervidicoccus fontis Kam940]MBE9391201.1 DNA-directed RNA polymerase subunit H [Fervidicoccus fontis]
MSPKKFSVQDHVLVPKHERIPITEVPKVLKELNVSINQLPLIRSSDPVAREIGAKPGELVKITRRDEITGESVVYRLVVIG